VGHVALDDCALKLDSLMLGCAVFLEETLAEGLLLDEDGAGEGEGRLRVFLGEGLEQQSWR
jgi:hypothetical protein